MTKHIALKLTENITNKRSFKLLLFCYVNNYKITLLKHNTNTVSLGYLL